jgi:catechol 2,3-dioxygenase-like lactoylglutathione lyase family enzyme
MKGVKIIRTSNWDAMTQFYRDHLGMNERDHDSKDSLHEFADFGAELHLERVGSPAEHEVSGSLEFYSSDPESYATFLSQKKGLHPQRRFVGSEVELYLFDPDGHMITFVQKPNET